MVIQKTIIGALFLLILAYSQAQAQQAKAVGTETVSIRKMIQTMPVSGRLVARQSGVVASRINGPIEEVFVDVGDHVETGQILVKLVSDRLEYEKSLKLAELERAQAALSTSKAEFNITTQELKRLERLRKSAAFNQARFDDKRLEQIKAKSAVSEAEADVRKAKAELALSELDLTYSEIKAPFPGTVTQKQVDQGTYVTVGQSVIQIVNAQNLEIEADIPTTRVKALTTGTTIHTSIANGTSFQSHVRAIVPEENPLTRTRAVRFSFNEDVQTLNLASNQTISLAIPLRQKHNILTVSKDALLTKKNGKIVFAIVDGKATVKPVKLGDPSGNYFEVLDGLKEGDIVITRGNERIRPGQAVQSTGSN